MKPTVNLRLEQKDIYHLDQKIFTIPVKGQSPEVAGIVRERSDQSSSIYIGTGDCCHGHLYQLGSSPKGPFTLQGIFAVDLNVYDIFPLVWEQPYRGIFRSSTRPVLTAGSGCAGAGVRLLDMGSPQLHTIVPGKEYHHLIEKLYQPPLVDRGLESLPVIRVDAQGNIVLDIHLIAQRIITEDTLPDSRSAKINLQAKPYVVDNFFLNTLDITDRLYAAGIDIEKTRELFQQNYHRIRPSYKNNPLTAMDIDRAAFPLEFVFSAETKPTFPSQKLISLGRN